MYYRNKPKVDEVRTSGKIVPIDGKIYWHIENFTPDMPKYKTILAFEQTFAILQPYFKPKFEATAIKGISQITIRFKRNGQPGLPHPFNANTLAYAYLANNTTAQNLISDIFFNENFNWTETHAANGINLRKVAIHEALHALGLYHSDNKEDILYPVYQPNDNVVLTQDTIDSIYKLYGVPQIPGEDEEEDKPAEPAEDILKVLFKTAKDLNKLKEVDQILPLAKHLGISAHEDDLKKDTINKIIKTLHP